MNPSLAGTGVLHGVVGARSVAQSAARPVWYALPLAYLPLFVGVPGLSIPLLHMFGVAVARDSVNVSFSLLVCLIGAWLWLFVGCNRHVARHISYGLIWLTASVITGMFFEAGPLNILYYVQTILPLFAAAYGAALIRERRDIARLVSVASFSTACAVAILLALAIWNFGIVRLTLERISVMKEIAYAVPQFKGYFPLTVLATFSFSLARYLFSGRSDQNATLLLVGHALFLPLCWSRAGMLGFAVCTAFQLGYAMVYGATANKQRAIMACLLFALVLPAATSKLGSTVGARTGVHELDNRSDRLRLELCIEGFRRVAASPLFGDMFIPTWEELAGGQEAEVKRLFGAHNQYADLGLRGGFPYLLLALMFNLRAVFLCFKLASKRLRHLSAEYTVIGIGGAGFLISTLVGANFQLYFIQLQTAVPIYLCLGVIYRVYQLSERDSQSLAKSTASPRRARRLPASSHHQSPPDAARA